MFHRNAQEPLTMLVPKLDLEKRQPGHVGLVLKIVVGSIDVFV